MTEYRFTQDRIRRAKEAVENNLSMTAFARSEGVSASAIYHWLKRHNLDDLHRRLIDGFRGSSLPADQVERRAIACARAAGGITTWDQAAIEADVRKPVLMQWCFSHADEVEEAINDLGLKVIGSLRRVRATPVWHQKLNHAVRNTPGSNLRLPRDPKRALSDMNAVLAQNFISTKGLTNELPCQKT